MPCSFNLIAFGKLWQVNGRSRNKNFVGLYPTGFISILQAFTFPKMDDRIIAPNSLFIENLILLFVKMKIKGFEE